MPILGTIASSRLVAPATLTVDFLVVVGGGGVCGCCCGCRCRYRDWETDRKSVV